MNKVIIGFQQYGNAVRIRCEPMRLHQDCVGFGIVELADMCEGMANLAALRVLRGKIGDLLEVKKNIEFMIDFSGTGIGVANLLERRGFNVVDMRKVGMVPAGQITPIFNQCGEQVGLKITGELPGGFGGCDSFKTAPLSVPKELLEAATPGSGYSGRIIPLQTMLESSSLSREEKLELLKLPVELANRVSHHLDGPPVELEPTDEPITVESSHVRDAK